MIEEPINNCKGHEQRCSRQRGSLNYKFGTEEFEGKVSIPPVVLSGRAAIKTKDSSMLNFTLVDWQKSITVTNEIKIYPRD